MQELAMNCKICGRQLIGNTHVQKCPNHCSQPSPIQQTPRTNDEESTVDDNKVVPSSFARTLELEVQESKEQANFVNDLLQTEKAAREHWATACANQHEKITQLKAAGESMDRVLAMHDSKQISISIPKWEDMKQRSRANWTALMKGME